MNSSIFQKIRTSFLYKIWSVHCLRNIRSHLIMKKRFCFKYVESYRVISCTTLQIAASTLEASSMHILPSVCDDKVFFITGLNFLYKTFRLHLLRKNGVSVFSKKMVSHMIMETFCCSVYLKCFSQTFGMTLQFFSVPLPAGSDKLWYYATEKSGDMYGII